MVKTASVMENVVSQPEVKAEIGKLASKLPANGFQIDASSTAISSDSKQPVAEESRRQKLRNFADKGEKKESYRREILIVSVQTSLINSTSKQNINTNGSSGNAEQGQEAASSKTLPLPAEFFDLLIFAIEEKLVNSYRGLISIEFQ